MDEGAGERASGPHAAAQGADHGRAAIPELDELERLADAVFPPVDGAEESDVLLGREIRVEGGLLGHVADTRQHRQLRHAAAKHRHRALFGCDQADKAADQGRLAGSVRAEQTVDLAATDAQADTIERRLLAEPFGDAFDLDGVAVSCHASSPPVACRAARDGRTGAQPLHRPEHQPRPGS